VFAADDALHGRVDELVALPIEVNAVVGQRFTSAKNCLSHRTTKMRQGRAMPFSTTRKRLKPLPLRFGISYSPQMA